MNLDMIFTDFERKYSGSFLLVEMNNKPAELFQMVSVRNRSTKFPELMLRSDVYGNIILNFNTSARLRFKIPQSGYVQNGPTALFFTRKPERQWKRGINASNCTLQNPVTQYTLFQHEALQINFDLIRKAFNPTYATLTQALDLINNKKYESVALNRNMAIAKHNKQILVFYRYAIIGTVSPDGVMSCPFFEKEATSVIK